MPVPSRSLALLLLVLLLLPTVAVAERVYLIEGDALPDPSSGMLRQVEGLSLWVSPDRGPTPRALGLRPLRAPEGHSLYLVDTHGEEAQRRALAEAALVLHAAGDFAVVAADREQSRRLDPLGLCRERLHYVPAREPVEVDRVLRRVAKVDLAAKQAIVDALSESRYAEILRKLSGDLSFELDGSSYTTDNRYVHQSEHLLAAGYLEDRLAAAGYTVVQQAFDAEGSATHNVIGVKTGTLYPDEIVVVGAHYDSISQNPNVLAPGAEDNASGTAAVLLIAEAFADYETERTIHFVLFSAEEIGILGSQYYVDQAIANGDDIIDAITLDMVSAWVDEFELTIEGESAWEALMELTRVNVETYGPIPANKTYFSWGSDHVSFQDAGIPAFLAIDQDWSQYADYHRTTDTFDKCDPSLGWRIARGLAAALADLTNPTPSGTASPPSQLLTHLEQNHPNPFNPSTEIRFSLAGPQRVSLRIYDAAGRHVRTLLEGPHPGGADRIRWDGRDAIGREVASGLYLCRLASEDGVEVRKMVLAR